MKARINVGKCDCVVAVQEAFYNPEINCFNIVTTNSLFQTEMGVTKAQSCLQELMLLSENGCLDCRGYNFYKVKKF